MRMGVKEREKSPAENFFFFNFLLFGSDIIVS